MRLMSFMLTTEQIRQRTKTVTRRLGWRFAKVGDIVQPVVKSQGLKKGETVEKIGGPIRFVSVRRGQLRQMLPDSSAYHEVIDANETALEGFPEMSAGAFVAMFCEHNNCEPSAVVTRIEFEYLRGADD